MPESSCRKVEAARILHAMNVARERSRKHPQGVGKRHLKQLRPPIWTWILSKISSIG